MCSAPVRTGGCTKEKEGYHGTNVSGNTTSCAPLPAASVIATRTRSSVPVAVSRSGAICTAATRTNVRSAMFCPFNGIRLRALKSPAIEDEGVGLAVQQHEIEHIERIDRDDALDQGRLTVPIERLQCEAACID